jgi:RHS repeat-associated protein
MESDGDYKDDNKFRFSTKYFEDDWGLSYYGYRYYHPDTGRWLSRDPAREIDPALYILCENAGPNGIDLYGLELVFVKLRS